MIACKAGDIVLVPFPFTDLSAHKRRPALVLTRVISRSLPSLVLVAMITSQLESISLKGDYEIAKWHEAGLLHPSKVRLAKLVSLEEGIIIIKLGCLKIEDRKMVQGKLKELLADWL